MPKSKMINVGVLGCANIADRFVIPAFLELNELFCLKGIASRNDTKSKEFAEKFNCESFNSYDELVKLDSVDLLYIPLPNSIHYEWIKAALLNNKHVLVEKSLSCSLRDVIELNTLAEERNLVLLENFQFRFHTQLAIIKELLVNNVIGEIRNIKSSFGFPPFPDKNNIRYSKELGGGALLDAGAYPLKVAQEILGQELYVDSASLHYNKELEVDIWGAAQLKSRTSNVVVQTAFGFDNFYQCNLEVWGSKGIIKANRIFTSTPGSQAVVTVTTTDGEQELSTPEDNHFKNLLSSLYKMVTNKTNFKNEYAANINQAKLIHDVRGKSNV